MNLRNHGSRIASLSQIERMGHYHNCYAGTLYYSRYWMLASFHRSGYRLSDWSYLNLPRFCGFGKGWSLVHGAAEIGQGGN